MGHRQGAKQPHRHVALLHQQGPTVHRTHPAGEIDGLVYLDPELAGNRRWGRHGTKLQHLAGEQTTLIAHQLGKAAQPLGLMLDILLGHIGAAAVAPRHQPPFDQHVHCLAHRHA